MKLCLALSANSIWKFLGEGLNPTHSCNLCRSPNPLLLPCAGDQTSASTRTLCSQILDPLCHIRNSTMKAFLICGQSDTYIDKQTELIDCSSWACGRFSNASCCGDLLDLTMCPELGSPHSPQAFKLLTHIFNKYNSS